MWKIKDLKKFKKVQLIKSLAYNFYKILREQKYLTNQSRVSGVLRFAMQTNETGPKCPHSPPTPPPQTFHPTQHHAAARLVKIGVFLWIYVYGQGFNIPLRAARFLRLILQRLWIINVEEWQPTLWNTTLYEYFCVDYLKTFELDFWMINFEEGEVNNNPS